MLTLVLPAHGSHKDLIDLAEESSVQIKIMRDMAASMPELTDEYSHARGRDAIYFEFDRLEEYRREWYRFETDSCYVDENGEIC